MSTSQNESLRDIAQLAQSRNDGEGGRAMERIAKRSGFTISASTFDRIAAGTYRSKAQKKTLQALAYLAGIPEERVYKAADRRYVAKKFADQLPDDVDQLDEDQREALIYTARAFLKSNREIERLQNELQELRETGPSVGSSNVVEADFATEDAVPEQKIPSLDDLAAHPDMPLQADRDDEYFDQLGEESQDN